jgi:potassium-transporting ATPase KdpC subunit
MLSELLTALRLIGLTIIISAVAYPLGVLAVAAVAVPDARMGSLLTDSEDRIIGSRLVAQSFARPEYFWPRPSAVDYNATAAGGSNLSPANPAIGKRAEEIVARLALPLDTPVPADLVTASGAGLDPHISYAGAIAQASRVAAARGVSENEILQIVAEIAESIPLTAETAKIVNVLELNLALDAARDQDP